MPTTQAPAEFATLTAALVATVPTELVRARAAHVKALLALGLTLRGVRAFDAALAALDGQSA